MLLSSTLALQLLFSVILFLLHIDRANACTPENASPPEKEIAVQGAPSNQWGPPYPFTPEQMQKKLIQILQIPAKGLSKEAIEGIFEMKFLNSGKLAPDSLNAEPNHQKFYSVYTKALTDWYFVASMTRQPRVSSFDFTWWGYDNAPTPYRVPMCIDVQPLLKEIENLKLGWTEISGYGKGRPIPDVFVPRYDFRRGKDELLNVDYLPGTTCMTDFAFTITNRDSIH